MKYDVSNTLGSRILAKILITLLVITILLPLGIELTSRVNAQLPLPPGVSRKDVVILDIIQGRTPDPDNFNVWVIGVPQGHIHQLCVDTLWFANLSDPMGRLVNVLAAAPPSYNKDYTVITIKLKQGVYWSDGVEFTADDVVFTIKAMLSNPNLIWYATATTWVKDVKAVDKYTVEITLTKPNPYAHYIFVVQAWNAMYIMPKHYFEGKGVSMEKIHEDKFNPPVCIGPYVLHSYDPGGMWFLWKRRDDYLRSDLGDLIKMYGWYGGPQWVLERAFLEMSAKVLEVLAGNLDTIFDPSPEAFETIRTAMKGRIVTWLPEWPYFWGFDPTNRGLYFNAMKHPYNISEVRWALTLAINMTKIMTEAYRGIQRLFILPTGTQGPTMYWEERLLPWLREFTLTLPDGTQFKPFDETIPIKIYEWAKAQGYVTRELSKEEIRYVWGIGWWKYAPDVAEKMLLGLGFKKDAKGMWLLPTGEPWKVTIVIPTYEYDAIVLGQAAAEEWRRFGIDVSVIQLESTPFWQEAQYGRFEVGSYWGLFAFASDPYVVPFNYQILKCDFVEPLGNYSPNWARYCNPSLDELIDNALSTLPGTSEQISLSEEIIKFVIKERIAISTGDCKKLLFYVTDYWEGWPSSANPGVNPMFWCEPFKVALVQLYPKGYKPTPSPSPSPSPRPTPTAATVTIVSTVTSISTTTVLSTVMRTETTTVTVTDWTTTIILAIVLLIIGFAIGYIIKRK